VCMGAPSKKRRRTTAEPLAQVSLSLDTWRDRDRRSEIDGRGYARAERVAMFGVLGHPSCALGLAVAGKERM